MLNKPLYTVLRKHFGDVKISNEDIERLEDRIPGKSVEVIQRGEHYNVCCPFCGDERHRLSISYLWLVKPPLAVERITHLINCYNEKCEEVYSEEFRAPFLDDLELAEMGILPIEDGPRKVSARTLFDIRLPVGFQPLHTLPPDHPAIKFAKLKYNIPIEYMSKSYEVGFTGEFDEIYPKAQNRIIFPIRDEHNKLVGWQARSVDPNDKFRWYLPPGFVKCVYNISRIVPFDIPVITEGIPSAIACGPTGTCLFGKSITNHLKNKLADISDTVIIATDPETFVIDPREKIRKTETGRVFADVLRRSLGDVIKDVRMIQWPDDILELARRRVNGDSSIKVPDPADMGLLEMKKLLDKVR